MRRSLRGAVGLAAVGLLVLAALPSGAASNAERQLLGIRIWRTYRDVQAKHGQPTRVEIGAVTAPSTAGGAGGSEGSAGSMMMPGGSMLPGLPGAGMEGAGMPAKGPRMMGAGAVGLTSPGGYMSGGGMGPAGPMGGGPSSGGMMGPMSGGVMGGPRMGGMLGGPGAMPPSMGGPGGMLGGPSGMPSGMMGMGGGGIGMGGGQAAASEPEITWVYEKGANTNYFLFNKDGRVIQIQAFGYKGSAITSRGLKLGDPVSRVYRLYGWPDKTERQGDNLTLDYSTKAHAAFQLTDLHDGKGTRVVGITVALTEKPGE